MNRAVVTNPDMLILNRKGAVFATSLSGNFKPFVLQEMDIVLLFLCLNATNPENVVERFQKNPLVKKLAPAAVPSAQIRLRMQQFLEGRLLQAATKSGTKRGPRLFPTRKKPPGDGWPTAQQFRVSTNFALVPDAGAFKIWSAKNQRYYFLDLKSTVLLNACGTGNRLAEIVRQGGRYLQSKEIGYGVQYFLAAGLLFAEPNSGKAVATPGSKVLTPAQRTPVDASDGSVCGWKDLTPDGRIPVYFVTHMQNHYPLALGMLFSAIVSHNSGMLLDKFQLIPITYFEPADLLNGPYRKFGKGVWLFSNYMWSIALNLQISASVKNNMLGNLCIHGGPSTPNYQAKCTEFLTTNSSVDIAVHGEGEVAIVEVLECLRRTESGDIFYESEQLQAVNGITFVNKVDRHRGFIRTEPRSRLKEPDAVPSPYLGGMFDTYGAVVDAAIIESNRGCPFGCTFCDWGSAINQKVRKFDFDRVVEEIDWVGKHSVRVLWIADANFGLYDRDIELARAIVKTKHQYGFPQEVVVNYTKNSTWRLAEIIKIFTRGGIVSQGIISIQTADEETLKTINRKNIKAEKYDELLNVFADLDLPLSTDLMMGLPGITVATFNNDLQRYIDFDVSVKAYPTQLLPNSPMADPDYMEKYQIKVDSNDFLISTRSYTEQDMVSMKAMFRIYTAADGYSLLRYVLRFLQWEHDIRGMDLLDAIKQEIESSPGKYPHITFAFNYFETEKCMPGGWKVFYDEIAGFVDCRYGIKRDSAFNTVLRVNEVCMPDDSVSYPLAIQLAHDFSAYFLDRKKALDGANRNLADYPRGTFRVADPNSMSGIDNEYLQYDTHQYFWELQSTAARSVSSSEFTSS